jgi:aspartyl-tRNA(Asn)/glutamyl-tRNA(Gln) amidotransferase subunit B
MTDPHDTIVPIIGLEIHVELATATKMFCRCRNRFGDAPNTNVCPVCIGMPGVLPVMNRRAVELAMKVALALRCAAPPLTKWDRKNYYYPDLPKNYQISQYDLPLGAGGCIDVPVEGASEGPKRVRIRRAHLEEDAGKNVHDSPAHTGVDLNRAGVPLLEIVSEPDIHSAGEAGAYARAMQRLVRWLGASEASMQKGHMRFEPNINLHITRDGQTFRTPIIEVKNLNSFRALEGAVEYEIRRQYDEWLRDASFTLEKLGKQNRGWDDVRCATVFQREKEEAHDYRYLPDPDLVPVLIDDAWRQRVAASVGEVPLERRARYIAQYGLSPKEADALTMDAPSGDLLDSAVRAGAEAKRCVNLLLGKVSAAANQRGCSLAEVGVPAGTLAELAKMLSAGQVNATAGDKILERLIEIGAAAAASTTIVPGPMEVAKELNLLAVSDASAVEAWVEAAIAANPGPAGQVRSGDKKAQQAFGFLVGATMKASGGKAPPALVKALLEKKLKG